MEIDIENLIEEVKQRPALYDSGLAEYRDRNVKKKLWDEICGLLNTKWDTLGKIEKTIYVKEVQTKWNSVRDCFRRELHIRENTQPGAKKKAKYRYFDVLMFLIPFTTLTQIKHNEPNADNADAGSPSFCNNPNELQEESTPNPKRQKTNQNQEMAVAKEPSSSSTMAENNIKILNTRSLRTNDEKEEERTDYDDDDKLFLLSLSPSFKDCTMDEKFALRIEIMKTIMTFKQIRREMGGWHGGD